MRAVNTLSVANGIFTVLSFATLLIMRPAAISSPHDTATSAMTKPLVNLPALRLEEPRPSSLSPSTMFVLVAWSAGTRPDTRADNEVMATTNISTGRSSSNTIQKGGGFDSNDLANHSTPKLRHTDPDGTTDQGEEHDFNQELLNQAAAAGTESGPNRHLTSPHRCAASSRLVTFTHAMMSTPKAAPSMVYRSP